MYRVPPSGRHIVLGGALLAALALPAASPAGQYPPGGQRPDRTLEEAMRVPQAQEMQRFGASVSRVRVDVIVTDGDGNFVPDLTAEDFVVYEDGVRQKVLDVQLVDLAAGAVHPLVGDQPAPSSGTTAANAPSNSAAGALVTGNTAVSGAAGSAATVGAGADGEGTGSPTGDTPARSAASELGAVIFLVDGPSLSPQTRARFGDAWADLLDQTGDLQVPRAAYMIDNVGRLEELVPLGYDLDAMRAAAETVRSAPFMGDQLKRQMIEIVSDLTNPAFADAQAAEDVRRAAQAKVRDFEAQERNRALATYELLTSFADALWTRSGRTAVVWVSTGIKLMQGGPYTALFAQDPSATSEGLAGARFDIVSPDPRIAEAQEALLRAANGANVSFYTVDPSLLNETRQMGVDVELAQAGAAQMMATPAVQQSIDGLRDSLRTAAAETGGQSFIHATDLGMVLQEIETDTSHFYLLSYEPPEPDGDGEWHDIRVEVARDGVDVRSRGGYVDTAPDERARRLIAAALALPGSVADLPVEAQTFHSRRPAGEPNLLMAVAVDGADVGIMLTPAGERHVSLDIHAVMLRDGDKVDESHESLNARAAGDGTFRAAGDDAPAQTLAGFLAYEHEWSLEPGDYTLNVAAYDNVSGRVGATSLPVTVPAPSDAWGISDPLLVTIDDAGHVSPMVLGRVMANQSIAAFVEVYNGVQPILTGQVFLESDTDETPQSAKLFPLALRRIGPVTHSGSAPLPPGMPPGHYIVQLTITDPPAEHLKVVRLPIEVVAPPER